MAQDIQTFSGALPAPSAKVQAKARELAKRFTTGIPTSAPVLSLKGSRFTLRIGAQEAPFTRDGMPIPVDVVLVNSSPYTNKTFYIAGYDNASKDAPDCWSNDGVYPDASIPEPLKQNPTCFGCRHNKFGTAIAGKDGKGGKGKRCSDSRKVVLAFLDDLFANQVGPTLVRLPVKSLPNLKNYVDYLANAGFSPNSVVTRLTFDQTAEYPRLKFAFERVLDEQELDIAFKLEEDQRTLEILKAPPEGDAPSIDNPNTGPEYADVNPDEQEMAMAPVTTPPLHSAPQEENHPVLTPRASDKPAFLDGLQEAIKAAAPPEEVRAAPTLTEVKPPEPKKERPSHIIDLPNGQFYDPIGRFYCNEVGERLDAAPSQEVKPEQPTWAPPSQAPSFQANGPAVAPATKGRMRRTATADKPADGSIKAETSAQAEPAPPELDDVLSGFVMPPAKD